MRVDDTTIAQLRAARRDDRLAVLEGFHAIKHALRFGAELELLAVADPDELERLAAALAPDLLGRFRTAEVVPREALGADAVAVASRPAPAPVGAGAVVLLEAPRNLSNLGACVRVAAAAGAAAVLTTGTVDPWHPDALRGSAGLHFALPVRRVDSLPQAPRPLVAVDPSGAPFEPARLPPDVTLAFGSERYGLSDALLARADARVSIPMRAGVSSLNLATAVAAVLYAWRLAA
jgi:TrmH family RNA methyltransferase